jgi:hypothetical protein
MKATKFVRSLFTLSVCLAMLLSLVPLQSALAIAQYCHQPGIWGWRKLRCAL